MLLQQNQTSRCQVGILLHRRKSLNTFRSQIEIKQYAQQAAAAFEKATVCISMYKSLYFIREMTL